MSGKKVILVTLTLLVSFTFVNSLGNAFVSDDIAEIAQKTTIGDLGYIIHTYSLGIIRHLIYWTTYHIAGLTPLAFRIINIFFHLGSTILIYQILSNIYRSRRLAFFAASLFAVHPAIAEAFVWISGGIYTQYTFFFLLSFMLYIISQKSRKRYFSAVVFYLFSLMSHPVMPIGLFVVFPLYEFCFGNFKKNWVRTLPFFLLSLTYLLINLAALPQREETLQQVHYQQKGIDNPLIQIPVAISSYFELLFFPKTLTLYHSELSFSQISFALRAVFTMVFFGLILYGLKKNKSVFFWLSFFLISLSPTLTPFRFNWIVAERYLYLPSLGIFALTGFILDKIASIGKYKNVIYSIFAIILISLSARAIIRNIEWKNEDNLWIATGKTSPSSPNTHNNLGDVYGRWGNKERSLQEFKTAISLKPDYADAYHNAGNVYRELGQLDKALEYYQKAASLSPILWQSYQNMAAIYFQEKQYDSALNYMQKAITINPKNLNLRLNLAVIFLAKGDKQSAKQIFEEILKIDPQNQLAQQGLVEASK
ncbi:tetratricopeptide repeat protein [Candidatus Daviesbacteria bacterium]|nr:tetratricopeptide repeat protein [Candidatus Daviesbacteria bacterium]